MARMRKCVERLRNLAEAGSRSEMTNQLHVFQKKLQKLFPDETAMVRASDRYSLAYMRWGEDRPRLWVMDHLHKQVTKATQADPNPKSAVCLVGEDILFALDVDGKFGW